MGKWIRDLTLITLGIIIACSGVLALRSISYLDGYQRCVVEYEEDSVPEHFLTKQVL